MFCPDNTLSEPVNCESSVQNKIMRSSSTTYREDYPSFYRKKYNCHCKLDARWCGNIAPVVQIWKKTNESTAHFNQWFNSNGDNYVWVFPVLVYSWTLEHLTRHDVSLTYMDISVLSNPHSTNELSGTDAIILSTFSEIKLDIISHISNIWEVSRWRTSGQFD